MIDTQQAPAYTDHFLGQIEGLLLVIVLLLVLAWVWGRIERRMERRWLSTERQKAALRRIHEQDQQDAEKDRRG